MTKPEIDTSIERWAAEYREQAKYELIIAVTREIAEALPESIPEYDDRLNTCKMIDGLAAHLIRSLTDEQLVEWAARLDGSEIKSYETWADTVAQDEMSEEAYARWKGAGL